MTEKDMRSKIKAYENESEIPPPKIKKTDEEWKQQLNEIEYFVTREKGTERPFFEGSYYYNKKSGEYYCKCCNSKLFSSATMFNAGCGWPSFAKPEENDAVIYVLDKSHGWVRTEVKCATCHAHLGHVFDDGPLSKGGFRYCINSVALNFEEKQ